MAIRGMTLMGAVEDIDEDGPVGEEEVTVDLPTETSDADDEVEDTQEVIDSASDDTEKLEEIKDVLRKLLTVATVSMQLQLRLLRLLLSPSMLVWALVKVTSWVRWNLSPTVALA